VHCSEKDAPGNNRANRNAKKKNKEIIERTACFRVKVGEGTIVKGIADGRRSKEKGVKISLYAGHEVFLHWRSITGRAKKVIPDRNRGSELEGAAKTPLFEKRRRRYLRTLLET